MATTDVQHAIARIERALAEQARFGSIHVKRVQAQLETADDEPILRFVVWLADPPSEEGAWPSEDVFDLRRTVHTLVAQQPEDLPRVAVELLPETPDPIGDDGDDDLANALGADEAPE